MYTVRTRLQLPLDVYKFTSILYPYPSSSLQFNHLNSQHSALTLYPPTKPSNIMRFSAAILALAASASAVAVPRAQGDNWDVMISKFDSGSTSVTAHFHSEANPDTSRFGGRFTCIIDEKTTPNWCDHNGVSADFDGKSKSYPNVLITVL
jgi:hypothetical protein